MPSLERSWRGALGLVGQGLWAMALPLGRPAVGAGGVPGALMGAAGDGGMLAARSVQNSCVCSLTIWAEETWAERRSYTSDYELHFSHTSWPGEHAHNSNVNRQGSYRAEQ